MILNMTKRFAIASMFAAFAIILSYIEVLIPVSIGIPGAKLGLANLIIVLIIYNLTLREAIMINLVRIIVIGLLFGNLFGIMFSIAGAGVSLIIMYLLRKLHFHMIVVSVAGGVSHNIGQLAVASIIVRTHAILYYIPVLILAGILTGLAIGIVASVIDRRFCGILKRGVEDDILY